MSGATWASDVQTIIDLFLRIGGGEILIHEEMEALIRKTRAAER